MVQYIVMSQHAIAATLSYRCLSCSKKDLWCDRQGDLYSQRGCKVYAVQQARMFRDTADKNEKCSYLILITKSKTTKLSL